MQATRHLSLEELEAGLDAIRQSPRDAGRVELIVRRPRMDEREALTEARLDRTSGLVGDMWPARKSTRTPDGSPHPDMQLTLMNSRVIALLAQDRERWPLAGDQLYVDLDLSADNLPPGTRLQIGSAVIEVTSQPHTGCAKFAARFGEEALKFVNGPERRMYRLRGINAKIIEAGVVKTGDVARKIV
ncbi:MAG: MOSC domain-containing protein [Chloroflexota bacterium]